jgi:CheY-like chemotaxis protein
MDALSALSALKGALHGVTLPAAIVFTGHDREVITSQPNASLADRVLTKPVDPSDLFNAVSDAMARSGRHGSNTDAVATTELGLAGRRVLVVDDSELNLLVARRILELHGAVVLDASSGTEAIATLTTSGVGVDVLLLDVQMPEVDGYEVARRVRAELGLTALPIIALTAGAMVTERDAALAAGMNAFLTKPLDPTLLVTTILDLTPRAVPHPDGVDVHPSPEADMHLPTIPGIDNRTVTDVLGDDLELFVELLDRLVAENDPDELARAATDVAGRDRDVLRAQLHKLRGSAGMLGAHTISASAGAAEDICRQGGPDAELSAALANAADGLRIIRAHLPRITGQAEVAAAGAAAAVGAPSSVNALRSLLERHDLAAMDRVDAMGAELQRLLGVDGAQNFRARVRSLDFAGAAAMLPPAPTPS